MTRRSPHNSRRPSCRRRGITLMEVLITLSLVSVIMPTIMHGVGLAKLAASTAQRRSEAGALAESKLAELVATGQWQGGVNAGTFDGWPDYQWTATVQAWTQGDGSVSQLDLHVTWRSRNPADEIVLSSLVYAGAGSGATATDAASSSSTGTGGLQ